MPAQRITIFPLSNSVKISRDRDVPKGLQILGQAVYGLTIQDWQPAQQYYQKIGLNDTITIMVHVQGGSSIAKLYLCDKYQQEISTIDLNVAPYFKGGQSLAGNTWTAVSTGTSYPLNSYLFSFTPSAFTDIVDGEFYYIRCDNEMTGEDTLSYWSEPLNIATDHPDTMLFTFTYNSNVARKNIIIGGWYNDFPFNSDPYSAVFYQRCEALVSVFVPKVINVGYVKQSYSQVQIKTDQVSTFTLKVGEVSIGIPYYMLQMITEALLADKLTIDDFPYIVFNPQSQTSLSDLWKIKDSEIAPLIFASTTIALVSESQNAIANPGDNPFARIFTSEFSSAFV